jgi:hypothetical protein
MTKLAGCPYGTRQRKGASPRSTVGAPRDERAAWLGAVILAAGLGCFWFAAGLLIGLGL